MNRLRTLSVVGLVLVALVALPATAEAEGPFEIEPGSFTNTISITQAGAHPDFRTKFALALNAQGLPAGGDLRQFELALPKGLLGAPTATPTCSMTQVIEIFENRCPSDTAVGEVTIVTAGEPALPGEPPNPPSEPLTVRIFNLATAFGEPAAFGFNVGFPVRIDTYLRPDGDYGATAIAADITQARESILSDATLWGIPADHQGPGPKIEAQTGVSYGGPSGGPRIPFLTNPTECSGNPLTSSLTLSTWQLPVQTTSADYLLGDITGCDQLEFGPTISAQPTTNLADAPSGLDFNLHLPQHQTLQGTNEVQSVSVQANGGQFNLSFAGQTTSDLFFFSGASTVQSALEALPAIGADNVAVSGGYDFESGSSAYQITFKGALGFADVEQLSATAPSGSASVETTTPGVPNATGGADLATARMHAASVTLPAGMSVNPSSANGLEACAIAEVGISLAGKPDGSPVQCPDASKLGTVEAVSPAIDHPLGGSVYLAAPNANPFGSLLALYLVVTDPKTGILVKIPGKVEADPTTGQLTTRILNSPDLPIEDVNLNLFEGNRAALRTPSACGTHTTTSTLTPWAAPSIPDASPVSSFAITKGPDGGACLPIDGGAPNSPAFSAGTLNPTAKAFSPFVLKLTREDGSQPFKAIDATLPKGLLAKLAGTPYCSDAALAAAAGKSGKAEQASPSCPAASQVGTVTVGAGAGSDPLYVSGKAYLAGPYKGAPLSLAILTPAVAGPFDLGTVVVRNALTIDPVTAQAHAVSDPIPTILQGIPLDIRSIAVNLDKPQFTLNPTSCDPSAITGSATSVFGQAASLSSRFQVGDCARLGFKPKLSIKLKGGTKRSDHPALTAVLKARPGDANIAETSVALPHSEFLAQDHIRTVCTRVQFAAGAGNGAQCPKGSIYGKASAVTPLLDEPLRGPVYLRSSDNPLPDLVVALHGQIDFNLVGRIDSKNGGIRTSFESVPDAPVTKFVLQMQGGKKGLLENSRNLCRTTNRASVQMEAQNASSLISTPVVQSSCKGKKKHGAKHRKHG